MCAVTPGAGGSEPAGWRMGCSGFGQVACTRVREDAQNVVFLLIPTCPSWKRRSVASCALVCDGMPDEVRSLSEAVAS